MTNSDRIYVAGHRGLVGSAITRKLRSLRFNNLLLPPRAELNLLDRDTVDAFFSANKPEFVFLAAAKVGGIHANSTYPAEFIFENLAIQENVINASHKYGVRKLLFLGSSCIYPKFAPQPIKEEYLLTGALEPTNEWYAIAKIAGIKMAQAYRRQYGFRAISAMPTNLYGPHDNFDLNSSHVVPALIRKFHEAKEGHRPRVEVWGTGTVRREFLHVDDLAAACVFLMQNYDSAEIVNVGTGEDLSVAALAAMIRDVVGFEGEVVFDPSKPDGTPRKLLDVSRLMGMGWRYQIPLRDGIEQTYAWYTQQQLTAA